MRFFSGTRRLRGHPIDSDGSPQRQHIHTTDSLTRPSFMSKAFLLGELMSEVDDTEQSLESRDLDSQDICTLLSHTIYITYWTRIYLLLLTLSIYLLFLADLTGRFKYPSCSLQRSLSFNQAAKYLLYVPGSSQRSRCTWLYTKYLYISFSMLTG